jgi:hypothetical protein
MVMKEGAPGQFGVLYLTQCTFVCTARSESDLTADFPKCLLFCKYARRHVFGVGIQPLFTPIFLPVAMRLGSRVNKMFPSIQFCNSL